MLAVAEAFGSSSSSSNRNSLLDQRSILSTDEVGIKPKHSPQQGPISSCSTPCERCCRAAAHRGISKGVTRSQGNRYCWVVSLDIIRARQDKGRCGVCGVWLWCI
jgi:hypothetical protein